MRTGHRSNESGIAIIFALFMMLVLSVIGATLITISTTETNSSFNYRQMSQTRYGAESAIHGTANYLLNAYVPPAKADMDAGTYDISKSPVEYQNKPVILSSVAADSNYPDDAIKAQFAAASQGNLDMKDATVGYSTVATLKSMRAINDGYSTKMVTIQTWEISGSGGISGPRTALVEVASVLERQPVPLFGYAAFATADGCEALRFAGGAQTNSYDSSNIIHDPDGSVHFDKTWGNVGTNGNLTEVGADTIVHGSLSTPRKGVGKCTDGNVTALDQTQKATVDKGLNPLPQPVKYPTPDLPSPMPPLTDVSIDKAKPCNLALCTDNHDPSNPSKIISHTITPNGTDPVQLGNLKLTAGEELHLKPGTYNVNSLWEGGGASIVVDDGGPVIINVAGMADNSGALLDSPITIVGGGLVNPSLVPSSLQILYAGTADIKMAGGNSTSAVVYAPKAGADLTGGGDLYGALVVGELKEPGGAQIHYDRHLKTILFMPGDYTMSAFTWKVAQ